MINFLCNPFGGEQGVPQTLIGGEMVIGFDKAKINRLLEIQG